MKSRRAISPVIATVILIAVAVALGIAVAVWAGALTGSLQKSEKLVINAYENSAGTYLNITITNNSPGSSTITQILFNTIPLATGTAWTIPSPFTTTTANVLPATLVSGASGTISVPLADFTVKSGITYPISIETAAGNTYPVTITWS